MTAAKGTRSTAVSLLFLLSVFLLAVIKIDDTDTWTHLSFGRLIWEQKSIPAVEPFIDTGDPFPYQNWLFGFVYYLAYLAFNSYGVILLKAATVTGAFYVLLKDAVRPYNRQLVSIAVLTVVVIVARHRFVERPDTFLMIFLPFSIFALNAFVSEGKKYIYALPLVHLIWANSHTSIPLMVVPFLSFLCGGALQLVLGKKGLRFSHEPSRSHLRVIAVVFAASFAASLISPYVLDQYTHGAKALGSDWWKQEVTELREATWQTYKSPYLITGALLALIAANWVMSASRRFSRGERQHQSLIHPLLIVPFAALSFSSVRFIFLYAMIAGPVLARYLSALLSGIETAGWLKRRDFRMPLGATALSIWIVLYTGSALAGVGPFTGGRTPGFGVNYEAFPEHALQYLDRRNITGRIFNLFQMGGYIVWRDFPKRKPFIDGRGFMSGAMLEKVESALHQSSVMEELDRQYGLDVVLLSYPALKSDVPSAFSSEDPAFPNPGWALVYWDDQALVYLKRRGLYGSAVRKDEYRFVKPANGIYGVINISSEGDRSRIIAELKRNIQETGSSRAYALLGAAYNNGGLYREALDAFSHVKETFWFNVLTIAYNGMGYAHFMLGDLDNAAHYYQQSLAIAEDAETYYNLGTVYVKRGDIKKARRCLERALESDPAFTSAFTLLIGIYRDLGLEQKAQRAERAFRGAILFSNGQKQFESGMKAYVEKRYDDAVAAFKQSIAANPSNPVPYSNMGFIYYDIFDTSLAYEYQRKALEVDPEYANAHYGLALIYKRAGDAENAGKHWREYLRLEPAGYYSRKAKEELKLLERR